jgi:hypothetical protein
VRVNGPFTARIIHECPLFPVTPEYYDCSSSIRNILV